MQQRSGEPSPIRPKPGTSDRRKTGTAVGEVREQRGRTDAFGWPFGWRVSRMGRGKSHRGVIRGGEGPIQGEPGATGFHTWSVAGCRRSKGSGGTS